MSSKSLTLLLVSIFLMLAITQQQQLFMSESKAFLLLLIMLCGLAIAFMDFPWSNTVSAVVVAVLATLIVLAHAKGEVAYFGALFSLIVTIASANLIYRYGHCKHAGAILLLVFWYYFIYILWRLSLNPNVNEVFLNSRNWISFYLVIFLSIYCINSMMRGKNLAAFPAVCCFLVSVYALGRSGIASSALLMLAVFVYKRQFFRMTGGAVCAALWFYFFIVPDLPEIETYRLKNPFGGDDRTLIWREYYEGLTFNTFVFGRQIEEMERNVGYSNLHSSLLTGVFHLGLAGYIVWSILITTLAGLVVRSLPVALVFLALLARMSTDTGMLFGLYDVPIWLAMLYALRGRPSHTDDEQTRFALVLK